MRISDWSSDVCSSDLRRNLMRPVRASATVQFDERRQMDVTTKFEGWIEKLPVAANGAPVKTGQTLTLIYSPALVQAQEEYLIAIGRASCRERVCQNG